MKKHLDLNRYLGARFDRRAVYRFLRVSVGSLVFCLLAVHASLAASAGSPSSGESGLKDANFKPRLGAFQYTISWEEKEVATATVTMKREAGQYRISVHSKTTGVVDNVYRIQFIGEGMINVNDFTATQSQYSEHFGSKEKSTSIYYYEDGSIEAVQVEKGKNEKLKKEEKKFKPEMEVLDVFSFMALARSFEWNVGLSERFNVFTGRKTYIVTLNCIGRDNFVIGPDKTDAWVIAPAVIDPSKKDKKPQRKETRIYLSADASKDILKIRTQTAIGTVRARLIQFESDP